MNGNKLFFGDCLGFLRDQQKIASESVDLIYLDPPFNAKRDFNLLFRTPKGFTSAAQATAFEDTWNWGDQAEEELDEIMHCNNADLKTLVSALRQILVTPAGHPNGMMAYRNFCRTASERIAQTHGRGFDACD